MESIISLENFRINYAKTNKYAFEWDVYFRCPLTIMRDMQNKWYHGHKRIKTKECIFILYIQYCIYLFCTVLNVLCLCSTLFLSELHACHLLSMSRVSHFLFYMFCRTSATCKFPECQLHDDETLNKITK